MSGNSLQIEMDAGAGNPTKTRCPIVLGMADGRAVSAEIFLLSDPSRPEGLMSVEATLDDVRDFIPVSIDGRNALVARDAILFAEMAPEGPGTGEIDAMSGSFDVVTLKIRTGKAISGVLRFPVPAESMRMSDVFNRPGRFLTINTGDRLILVAKAHVVEATF